MFLENSSRLRRWFFLVLMTWIVSRVFRLLFFRFPPPSCFLTVFFAVRLVAFLIEDLQPLMHPSLVSLELVEHVLEKQEKLFLQFYQLKLPTPFLFVEVCL